jgi:hypothetical protein
MLFDNNGYPVCDADMSREASRIIPLFNGTNGSVRPFTGRMSDEPDPFVWRVSACLRSANWSHTADEQKKRIWLLCGDNVSSLRVTLVCKDQEGQIVLFISLERHCPRGYRGTMADFCNRTNFRIPLGFWAVDPRDGEVRLRHATRLYGVAITPPFMDNFIKTPVALVRRSYLIVQAIMDGYSLPAAMKFKE